MPSIEVRGWLRESERLALRRWSFNKDVLELGAFEGLSTCNIAATCKSLVTVDAFDGRGTPTPGDTEQAFWQNINSVERNGQVQVFKGLFADILPGLDRKFDLIFIDGSHDYHSVMEDMTLAVPHLREEGVLVFHDYCSEQPGVVQAVNELIEEGARAVTQTDSLVMIRPGPKVAIEEKSVKIAVAMPHRDGWVLYGSAMAMAKTASQRYPHWLMNKGHSILPLTFNELFCAALNARDKEGATHFAMLHNDIVPETHFWIDVLMDELIANDLDMISAVVPLKNSRGLTSTGTDTPGYPWGVRRLTMHEVMKLPATFTAADVPHRAKDAGLLLNSGCWLMTLTEPWVRGLHFRQQDRIIWCLATQEWAAQSISEDWDFSRQLFSRGCRLGATRKVALYHQMPDWTNQRAWGEWKQDEDFLKAEAETARVRAEQGEAA